MSTSTPAVPARSLGRVIFKEALLLAVLSTAALTFLRSHDLTAVDGAVRAFWVYQNPHPQFHGSSHMLYPVYVLLWTRTAALLGFTMSDPLSFIRVAQEMNCVFAGLCAAILLGILRSLDVSRRIAWAGCVGWLFSRAVMLHATNSSEPLAGLFWSVAALAVVIHACRSGRMWLVALAGLLLAIAMASYQSMVLMAIACGVLTLAWPGDGNWTFSRAFRGTALLTLAFFVGILVVYGIAYRMQGVLDLSAAMQMFLTSPDRHVFAGFSAAKAVNVATGLASGVFLCFPADARLHEIGRHLLDWAPRFLLAVAAVIGIYFLLLSKFVHRHTERRDELWLLSVASWSTLAMAAVLIAYWVPLYEKMWIQPLWLLWLTGAIFANAVGRHSPRLLACAGVLVGVVVVANLANAIQQSRGPWAGLDEARRVDTFIGGRDLVVTDWGPVTSLYGSIFGRGRAWDFVSATGEYRSRTPDELKRRITETREHGGAVYFLGLLDIDRHAWEPFLGAKCDVPYDSLNEYRQNSEVISSFHSNGAIIMLRRLDRAE